MTDELIELVREREVLYDVKSKDYRDQSMKIAAWEEIAEVLNEPVNKCKEEWTKLRNAFASAMKRRRNKKSGQAAASYVPWKYEESLQFLLPYMDCRTTKTNLMTPPESPLVSIDDPCESTATSPSLTCSNNSTRLPPTLSCGPKSKKPKLQDVLDLMKSSHEMRRQRLNHRQDMDETDLFFLSMSKAVKALPKLQQTKIKLNLHTAISQAEIQQLEEKENLPRPPVDINPQDIIQSAPKDQSSINIQNRADFQSPSFRQSTSHRQFSSSTKTKLLRSPTYIRPTTIECIEEYSHVLSPTSKSNYLKSYYENIDLEDE